MTHRERVAIAEMKVARAPEVLVAYGLGSCLGIVLYDPAARVGGMAHTLLPSFRSGLPETRMTKFVDVAIAEMIDELVRQGARREGLQARIVGGANMFQPHLTPAEDAIGSRNVQAAREVLATQGIPLVAEDVGGSCGRTVEFFLETGEVSVRSVRDGGKVKFL